MISCRFVTVNLLSFESICIFLLSQALLVLGIQQMHVGQEMIAKISAAGQLMQCSASLDVLFLLDGSYSIGKGSFEKSKDFAGKLCDAFDIHPDRVRVGMIQFSSTPHLEFPLDSYPTKQEVKERIKRTVFRKWSQKSKEELSLEPLKIQTFHVREIYLDVQSIRQSRQNNTCFDDSW